MSSKCFITRCNKALMKAFVYNPPLMLFMPKVSNLSIWTHTAKPVLMHVCKSTWIPEWFPGHCQGTTSKVSPKWALWPRLSVATSCCMVPSYSLFQVYLSLFNNYRLHTRTYWPFPELSAHFWPWRVSLTDKALLQTPVFPTERVREGGSEGNW